MPRTSGCSIRKPLNVEPEIIRLLEEDGRPSEIFASTIADIFRKIDLVISNTIDFKELKALYDIVGKKITEPEYQSQLLTKYNSFESALTLKGFSDWFIDQTKQEGDDVIFTWLEKLGYDRELYSVKSRLFTVTLHSRNVGQSDTKMEVKIRDAIGTDVDNIVNKLVL